MFEMNGLYCPNSSVRIFSPQMYHFLAYKKSACKTSFTTSYQEATWNWGTSACLSIPYDDKLKMPLVTVYNDKTCASFDNMLVRHAKVAQSSMSSTSAVDIIDSSNNNISSSQKRLLKWHYRLGHINLQRVVAAMKSGRLGSVGSLPSNSSMKDLKCDSCCYAKAKRRAVPSKTPGKPPTYNPLAKGTKPGEFVSLDHMQTRTPGRLSSGNGKNATFNYTGASVFVDSATSAVKVDISQKIVP